MKLQLDRNKMRNLIKQTQPLEVEKVSLEGRILGRTGPIRDEGEYFIAEVRFENPFNPDYPAILEQACISITDAERGTIIRDFYRYGEGLYSKFTTGETLPRGIVSLIGESGNCNPLKIEHFKVKGEQDGGD